MDESTKEKGIRLAEHATKIAELNSKIMEVSNKYESEKMKVDMLMR